MNMSFLLIIGAVKAGTTTLYEVLKHHRKIQVANVKETNFFLDDNDWSLNSYLKKYFDEKNEEKVFCDIDPQYLYSNLSPTKIKKLLKDNVKFVVVLRNPIERAFSHYLMDLRNGEIDIPFEQAVEYELKGVSYKKKNPQKTSLNYIEWSLYSKYIENYLKHFSRENFLFLIFEKDIKNNLRAGVEKILKFNNLSIKELYIENLNIQANIAYEPRFRFVNKILMQSMIKNFAKIIIPNRKIRRNLRNFVEKVNTKRLIHTTVPIEIRKDLMDRVFKNDIEKLQNILDIDLKIWLY